MHTRLSAHTPPIAVARALHARHPGGVLFFDSGTGAGAGADADLTTRATAPRWSFLAACPSAVLTERDGQFVALPSGAVVDDPERWLRERWERHRTLNDSRAPLEVPFCGGLAGYLGFEFGWWLDDVRAPRRRAPTPVLWVGDFPAVAAFDHRERCWHLCGDPDSESWRALQTALDEARGDAFEQGDVTGQGARLTVGDEAYVRGVEACRDAIYAGELFEINYTERFAGRWNGTGFALFEALRARTDGGFGGYLGTERFELASVSPEQFLSVEPVSDDLDRPGAWRVETRPIKGTRPRSDDRDEDRRLAAELLASEKDRAENIMIVDLMRNDLTRVCRPGTVEAAELCALESYATVHHLVSRVVGTLDEGFDALDALLACFPAGSITGAPKLRSIELAAELEATPRGAYTGSMFYLSRNGRLDSNVLIRTASVVDGIATYGAGGAVVSESDPRGELDEARTKARVFLEAMGGER